LSLVQESKFGPRSCPHPVRPENWSGLCVRDRVWVGWLQHRPSDGLTSTSCVQAGEHHDTISPRRGCVLVGSYSVYCSQ